MAQIIDATMRLVDQFTPTLKAINNSINEQANVNKRMSRSIANVGKKFTDVSNMLAPAALAITGAVAASIYRFADFEESILSVAAKAEATLAETEEMKKRSIQLSKSYAYSAKEVAEGMDFMAAAGWKVKDILETTEPLLKLAQGSQSSMAQSSDLLTATMTSFAMETSKAEDTVNKLLVTANATNTGVPEMAESFKYAAPLAAAAGMSFEEMATAIGLMSNQGIKAGQAGTSLAGAMVKMLKPSGQASKAMEALKMNVVSAEGKFVGMRSVIDQFTKSTKGMGEAQKSAYAAAIFGQGALPGMMALINEGVEKYDALADSLNNSAGAADKAAETMGGGIMAQMKIMRNNVDSLALTLGDRLVPTIKSLTGVIQSATECIANINPGILNFFATIAGGIVATWAITGAVGSMIKTFSILYVPIMKAWVVIKALGAVLLGLNPMVLAIVAVVAAAAYIIYRNWEKIKVAFVLAAQKIQEKLRPLIAAWDNLMSKFGAFDDIIQDFLVVWEWLGNEFAFVASILEGKLVFAFEHLLNIVVLVVGVVSVYIRTMFKTLASVIDLVVAIINGDWQGAWNAAGNIVAAVIDGIKGIFSSFVSFFKDEINSMINMANSIKIPSYIGNGSGTFGIKKFASGTDNFAGGMAIVNEQGGELINLPGGSQIIPHDKTVQAAYVSGAKQSGGISVNVGKIAEVINVRNDSDIETIANTVAGRIATQLQTHGINQTIGAV